MATTEQPSTPKSTLQPPSKAAPRWPVLVILLIAIAHGIATHLIARSMSATYDEPMHAFSGALMVQQTDFRPGFDHPPLVHLLSGALQDRHGSSRIDTMSPVVEALGAQPALIWNAAVEQIFGRPNVDGVAFMDRARLPMVMVAIAGVLLVGLATRAVAGATAGMFAALLIAVDPNLLGHGSLVKNDVAAAVCFIGTAWFAWRMCLTITWPRIIGLGILFGVGLLTKFSVVALIGCIWGTLLVRAIVKTPWPAGPTHLLSTRGQRLTRCVGAILVSGAVCYVVIWIGYGGAYYASPLGSGDPINTESLLDIYRARTGQQELTVSLRGLVWINDHHLLPEAFVNGLIFQSVTVLNRVSYIMGSQKVGGLWYYFPVALLVKMPIATLILFGLATTLLAARVRNWRRQRPASAWAIALFGAVLVAYLIPSITSTLNIGIRHLFPIVPFLYVGAGWAVATLVARGGVRRVAAIIAVALAGIESAASTPNQLAFFNRAATAVRPTWWWLADSNLDWGQGLRALATWQADGHGDRPLYLSYFGISSPSSYGVTYRNMMIERARTEVPDRRLGGYLFSPPSTSLDLRAEPGYLVISAWDLQGVMKPDDAYAPLRGRQPLATLSGGAMYVFDTRDLPDSILTLATVRPATTRPAATTAP